MNADHDKTPITINRIKSDKLLKTIRTVLVVVSGSKIRRDQIASFRVHDRGIILLVHQKAILDTVVQEDLAYPRRSNYSTTRSD